MSTSLNITEADAYSTVARAEAGGFFTHHGAWAPGVRAFRTLRFRTKALIISVTFIVPILLLAASLQVRFDGGEKIHALLGFCARQAPLRSATRALIDVPEPAVPLRSFILHVLKSFASAHAQISPSGLSGWQGAN